MARIEFSVTIARDISEVIEFYADPTNVGKWHTEIFEVRQLPGGPQGVGSKSVSVQDANGRGEINYETTVYEPPRQVASKFSSSSAHGEITVTLERGPDGTLLTRVIDFELPGVLRVLTPLARRKLLNESRSDLTALKRFLESVDKVE